MRKFNRRASVVQGAFGFYAFLARIVKSFQICEHTKREFDRNQQKLANAMAEGRATPESRDSMPSYDGSDSYILELPNRGLSIIYKSVAECIYCIHAI